MTNGSGRLLLLMSALVMSGTAAHASGFVNDGIAWQKMSTDSQAAYIQGINDASNFIYLNDDLATATIKLARTRCLIEQKSTAAVLAFQISSAYAANRAALSQPPLAVYVMIMTGNCRNYINQERARLGLPPT